MSAVLSKTAHFRGAYRLFSTQTTSRLTPQHLSNHTPKTPPLPIPTHLPESSLRPLSFTSPRIVASSVLHDLRSFIKLPRFLSTNANVAKAQTESTIADDQSDKGKQSGDGSNQSSEQGKPVRGGPISWLSFLLLIVTGAGVIYYYDQEKKRHIEDINASSSAVKQGPSAGKAAIGGPFNLVDHNGRPVTENDFKGKWTLIYFGFTHCPDICPDELQKLAAAIDKIKGKAGLEIVPVFISVDPERDTVEQVHDYVKQFHPKLIGLTGDPEEIKKAARAYRVYYMKTEEEGSDYLVDHSIIMYLMDPNMEFIKFFGKNNDVDALTEGIINEIKQYKKAKA